MAYNKENISKRMDSSFDNFIKEVMGLRTGRASTSMMDPITVDVYGSKMPLNQLGTVSAPEPRLLTVQVWDVSQTKAVEKAIRDSGLGLNPQAEGSIIRLPIPELNEERRAELVKVARGYAEQGRIAIRNVRRDGMDDIKKMKNDGDISEDEQKRLEGEVQKLTDDAIEKVDSKLTEKEKDIMTV